MSTEQEGQSKKTFVLDFGSGSDPFNAVTVETETADDKQNDVVEKDTDTTSQQLDNQEDIDQDGSSNDTSDDVDDDDVADDGDEPYKGTETSTDDVADDDSQDDVDDSDVNLYYHVGQELLNDGFLPEDLELTDDVDGMVVYNAYKEKLKQDTTPVVMNEIHQEALAKGYDEQDLIISRALRQGVDPRLLSTVSMYETYSTMADDADDSQKESVISQMYRTRGFQESEIANQIEIARNNETTDELFGQSKTFFGSKYNEFLEGEKQREAQLQEQATQQARQTNDLINKVISEKRLMDVGMTPAQAKAFEDSIRKPTQVLEANGQKYKATEVQKFLYEFQTNDELKLLTFFLHKFRDEEKEQIKKNAKKEVETEFLKGYKQRIVKNNRASKNKAVKKKLDDTKGTKKNSFFLDFS